MFYDKICITEFQPRPRAVRMAKKKLKLTWQKGTSGRSGRWRKMIKGQTFYFDGGNGKSDRKAYQVAVEECEKLRVEILSKSEKPNAEASTQLAVREYSENEAPMLSALVLICG